MRTKKHYENLLNKNPGATVNLMLAAQAVYAARYGSYPGVADAEGEIVHALKSKYGEDLSVTEALAEMAAVAPVATTEMIVRKIPVSVHRDFKILCVREGKSMQEKIIELMVSCIS